MKKKIQLKFIESKPHTSINGQAYLNQNEEKFKAHFIFLSE